MPVTVDSTNDKRQWHAAGQANLAAPPGSVAVAAKSKIFALAQAFCYLLVCIAVMEVSFYLACVGDGEHVYPDLKVGYKIFAGKRITQRNEGFGCFKLNSFGMQNDETTIAKPAGTYRIAVFGDSYVEALQVPRQANYLNEVGEALSKRLGRPVEVLNFGVSNYSVAQDYLRYQTLAKQFKPDMVIQVFRCEEISKLLPMETQSLLFVRPVFFPGAADSLVYDNTCVRQFFQSKEGKRLRNTQWLRANSRIWGVISGMWQQALTFQTETQAKLMPGKKGPHFELPSDQTRSNYAKCYWYMMDAQLRAFQKECASEGSRFVILRTPMVRPGMHTLTDSVTETSLLAGTADKMQVPLLNLDRAYRTWAGTDDDGTNFSAGGHFTKPMHRWVADNLSDFLAPLITKSARQTQTKTQSSPE
jgi:hypothetical protein